MSKHESQKTTERLPWDQYFLSQALMISTRSTCPRLRVGAVIVREKRVIAGGYNGSVSGEAHCIDEGCLMVDGHCVRTVHAEMNAVLQCAKFGASTEGAEIYVTHFPCLSCAQCLIQTGIQAVHYLHDYRNNAYAIHLLNQAGVQVTKGYLPGDLFERIGDLNRLDYEQEAALKAESDTGKGSVNEEGKNEP